MAGSCNVCIPYLHQATCRGRRNLLASSTSGSLYTPHGHWSGPLTCSRHSPVPCRRDALSICSSSNSSGSNRTSHGSNSAVRSMTSSSGGSNRTLKEIPTSGSSSAGTDWVYRNSAFLRLLPLLAGGLGASVVVVNRFLSSLPAVADAGSSQTRADVLSLVLSAALMLTGLQWLGLKPRANTHVLLEGVPCLEALESLGEEPKRELLWLWSALSSSTRCRSLVVVYRGLCVLQAGVMCPAADNSDLASPVNAEVLWRSNLVESTRRSGRANYLANLALYPARFDLLSFLPFNTQAAILLPLGDDDGIMIIGGDTIRGFTPLDQAWISSFGEKLDSALDEAVRQAGTVTSTSN